MRPSLACTYALALTSALSTPASAQTLVRSVPGPAANAQFGKACIVVRDQNGDGYKDLIVGAPGFNQERGAIYCVSGAYLATGAGSATLWSVAPTANPGDHFGWSVAYLGDATGDGVDDFLVGEPGYDLTGANDIGAVRLVSGASHTAVSLIFGSATGAQLGAAVAAAGDIDYDGKSEVLIGSPGPNTSAFYVLRGTALASSANVSSLYTLIYQTQSDEELGASIAGYDYVDQGTHAESKFVVGAPGFDAVTGADAGKVYVVKLETTAAGNGVHLSFVTNYASLNPGERLGASVDGGSDYDGDGTSDVVVGAPNAAPTTGAATPAGRVVVLSGQKLDTHALQPELYSFTLGGNANYHLGTAVRACADLNGDGIGEILTGEPDYFTSGGVNVHSGATGTRIAFIAGGAFDHLGDALAGAVNDLDGDGFPEFVVAGSRSNAGGTGSGVIKCYRLFPIPPTTYCTGKVNSLGCTPAIAFSGTPSANSVAPFNITATNFVNQKNGLLFYSRAPAAVAFHGGTKCAANPIVRTPPMNSGGATSGSSCTGAYSFDFNDWIVNGWDASLAPGAEIYAQYWSRDPASASHTGLSNAIRFVINP